MESSTITLPIYKIVDDGDHEGTTYSIIAAAELELVPQDLRESFKHDEEVTLTVGKNKTIFMSIHKAKKANISSDATIRVSQLASETEDYQGILSDLLSSTYKFTRKSKKTPFHVVSL